MSSRRGFLRSAGAALLLPACRRTTDEAPAVPPAGGALRIDLRHTARNGAHAFEPLRVRRELHWPRKREVQLPDWGDFRVSVTSPDGVLYREGFESSISIDARAALTELSIRIPAPPAAVRVTIAQRRADNTFAGVATVDVDPRDPAIDASEVRLKARIETLLSNGAPEAKADLAILGDGYSEAEHPKFIADARRAMEYLLSVEPFARHTRDFNVVALFTPSAESGVTDPYVGRRSDTILRCRYGDGAAERTLSVGDSSMLREAASLVPYDFVLVLVNARRYGGSGHFGGPAVVAIDSAAARYLVLHELAHVIAGLAEEYYLPEGSGPTYSARVEPWQPNVTTLTPSPKWAAAEKAPTPWNKNEYDRLFARYVRTYERLREAHAGEQAVESLMRVAEERQRRLLARNTPLRRTGYFEGAHGYAKGIYRCEADCIMFSLQTRYFCAACEAALGRAIGALL